MATNRRKREVAWRVFASEFNSATVELPTEDQYAPSYLLSPIGAFINRIYFTGVLTESENVGTDQEPLWRGRVSDPTDVFFISAGQFQPNAARVLGSLEVPALVGIVGKARTYSPDDATTYTSVRVEQVKTISQELRDYWVIEACQSLNYRLGCFAEALQMEPPEIEKLMSLGYSSTLSKGVLEAINQYGSIKIQEYGELLLTTLKELTQDTSIDSTLLQSKPSKPELEFDKEVDFESETTKAITAPNQDVKDPVGKDKPTAKKETDEDTDDNDETLEKLVFEIINSLVEENPEGVIYEDVQTAASEHGLGRAEVEEHISSLIDKGIIYEPSIGLFKAV